MTLKRRILLVAITCGTFAVLFSGLTAEAFALVPNARPVTSQPLVRVLPTFPSIAATPPAASSSQYVARISPANPGDRYRCMLPGCNVAPVNVTSIAFGDSNTTNFLSGVSNWYERLQSKTVNTKFYTYQYNNQSIGGTSVVPTFNSNGDNLQYPIDAKLSQMTNVKVGYIMLGSNDAWRGVEVASFQTYYKQMIDKIKASGKIERLVVMAVPPMISPFNCIGPSCWSYTHNPQTERVVPYNQFLSSIGTYCASISYNCSYVNSANGILANSTYINASDGIHLLNVAQDKIATTMYNWIMTQNFL